MFYDFKLPSKLADKEAVLLFILIFKDILRVIMTD